MTHAQKETWYTWRVLRLGKGEKEPRLFTPWADPRQHEFSFNFLYENPDEARKGLATMGAEDEAFEQNWMLCKMTLEPLEAKNATLFLASEKGKHVEVFTETFYGIDDEEIRKLMIDRHWDERLTSASCSPYVVIEKRS